MLFHGAHGHLAGYHALARRLGDWRPVHGVRLPRVEAMQPPISIAALADDYAAALRPLVGGGPCTLAGNCLGGVLALETAQLLRTSGTEVAPAVLIDTMFPVTLARGAVDTPRRCCGVGRT